MGVKLYQGLKQDRVSDSLGSSANGTNTGITLEPASETINSGTTPSTWTESDSNKRSQSSNPSETIPKTCAPYAQML